MSLESKVLRGDERATYNLRKLYHFNSRNNRYDGRTDKR